MQSRLKKRSEKNIYDKIMKGPPEQKNTKRRLRSLSRRNSGERKKAKT